MQQSSLYLVKEFDNFPVFSNENSGRFDESLIDPHETYYVHGLDVVTSSAGSSVAKVLESPSPSPYGAYCGATTAFRSQGTTRTPIHRRKGYGNTHQKTIALVSLSAFDHNKPKRIGSLDHKIVTQLVITLDLNNCGPSIVADLIQQQVGFSVVLLDSKCFPILENSTTTTGEFWKSNRKILAASKELYTKLTGSSADPKRAKREITDLTLSDEDFESRPRKKKVGVSNQDALFDEIREGIEMLKTGNSLVKVLSDVFECIVCKDVMDQPLFARCCNRLIGCKICVNRWLDEHVTCPHCSVTGFGTGNFDVRGLDDMLRSVRFLNGSDSRNDNEEHRTVTNVIEDISDDDFQLPNFSSLRARN